MDSLLASYASSDDEDSAPNPQPHKPPNQPSKFSLPPPKSKHQQQSTSASSLFSSLPPAKPHVALPQFTSTSTKKVVQFRPPLNLASNVVDDDDDDDVEEEEGEKERKRKKAELAGQTPSVRSFLSSIPAPRNSVSLGVLGAGLGTGRRSVIDADVQGSSLGSEVNASEAGVSGSHGEVAMGGEVEYVSSGNAADIDGYSGYGGGDGSVEYSNSVSASGDYSSNCNDYVDYGDYGQYQNNWSEGSYAAAPEVPIDRALRLPSKRGRKDDPPQFIEVNQDELMKNRPREDQAKVTGIAFGPAYQPASSKGKPTKLHKRKHQIGALYFDMKSKESELAERRSKGFLTKAQTQGKYGW